VFTFIFIISISICDGQNNAVQLNIFSTHEGLSNNQVNCTIKDFRGYLWVGTAEGLNRFDGRHFRQYYAERSDTNSLNGNYIFDMIENRPGELLIATNNGLAVLNTITNSFQNHLVTDPLLKKGHGMLVSNLYKDKLKRIWINYNGVIDIYDEELHFLFRLTDQPWATVLKGVNIFYEKNFTDNKGQVWLASDNDGICVIDEKNKQVFNWQHNPLHYPFFVKGAVRSFYMDTASNKLYYGIWSAGLQCYDFGTGKIKEQHFGINYQTESRCVNGIVKQKDGNLLCAGGAAIYSVNPATLTYVKINNFNSASTLPAAFTNFSLFIDSLGNSWVGTYSFGLLAIPAGIAAYRQFDLPMDKMLPGYSPTCTDAARVGSFFYMAYNLDGLIEVNTAKGKINQYKLISSAGKTIDAFRICRIGSTTLWIGTGLGIYSFDVHSKKIQPAKELPEFTKTLQVSSLATDGEGNQWVAFSLPNAIGFYDRKNRHFSYYKNYIDNGYSFFNPSYKITCIKPDENGNVWMTSGIKGGMVCFHTKTKQWERFPAKESRNYLLFTENGIADLTPAGNDILWLTFDPGTGLVKYNLKKDSLIFFERKNGLLSDNISSIDKDNHGNLLLLSNNGLNYFDTATSQIQSRSFTNIEKNWSHLNDQFFDADENQLLYGVNNKILVIKNDFQKNDTTKIRVYIEDIHPFNIEGYSYSPNTPLILNHSESSFSISLSAPDFSENNAVSFAYQLQGYDKVWTITDSAQIITYKNLPPGNYRLLAKAKKHNGEWGPINDSVLVKVIPFIWETWWFMLLCFCTVAAIAFLLLQNRIKNIKYKAGLKQKIVETEMAALQAQMNPHFIFNCLNAIDNLIQTNQQEKATTYLARFARLIRSALDGAKNNVVSFQADFETIKLYLQMEQFRCNNKFSFIMTADNELMHSDIKVPPLLIQPFVENAILHGLLNKQTGERNLSVTASIQNEWIVYTITDNGVGRQRAKEINELNKPEHQSEGIRISKERLQLFNHDSKTEAVKMIDHFKDEKPDGTTVIAKIKIQ
jgi:ligand-binding sensor domain-containing protein